MTDKDAHVPAGPGTGATERYPMTEAAWQRLSDEEQRLSDISRRAGPGSPADDAPDAAAVADWIRDVDSLGRRLTAIREAVASAEIVGQDQAAVIGREIRVLDEGAVDDYRLVIPGTGDPTNGAISVGSPLGGALLGAGPGQSVAFETPAGTREVTVVEVGSEAEPF